MNACLRQWALLAVVSACAASSQAIELRGFRGVPWGAGVASLGAATLTDSHGDVSCYRRERENMLYGDSPVRDIRFCFNADRLFMVALDADVDLEQLVREFQSTYGPPDWRVPAKTTWGDHRTRARVEMVSPSQGGASMLMYSNEHEPRAKRDLSAE